MPLKVNYPNHASGAFNKIVAAKAEVNAFRHAQNDPETERTLKKVAERLTQAEGLVAGIHPSENDVARAKAGVIKDIDETLDALAAKGLDGPLQFGRMAKQPQPIHVPVAVDNGLASFTLEGTVTGFDEERNAICLTASLSGGENAETVKLSDIPLPELLCLSARVHQALNMIESGKAEIRDGKIYELR